jgi:eukaryotic-like serine/threonine-protein kinase
MRIGLRQNTAVLITLLLWLQAVAPSPVFAAQMTLDWAMFRGDAARTGQQPGPGPKGAPSEQWRVTLSDIVVATPIVVGEHVFVAGWDGVVRALDLTSGDELWSFTTGSLDSTPAVVDGVVYAGGANGDESAGTLYAIDAETGAEVWRHETGYALSDSSPAVVDGVIYIGGGNGEETAGALYAIDATSGDEIWSFEATLPIWSSPAVGDDRVFVGGGGVDADNGAVYAVDLETGDEVWTFAVDDGTVSTTPAVVDGLVYVTTRSLYALDSANGKPAWTVSDDTLSYESAAAVIDDVVYVGGSTLSAFDAETGDVIWTNAEFDAFLASPVVADDVIYIGSYLGDLFAIDPATGDEIWSASVLAPDTSDNRLIVNSVAVVDGAIYVSSLATGDDENGVVHAFQ